MKLKSAINQILLCYSVFGIGIVLLGAILSSMFFTLLGLCVAIIGLIFANKLAQAQIIYNLKKNNLWDDEIPKKQKKDEAVQD